MSDQNKTALQKGLDLLSKRSYSKAILAEKLRLKDFDEKEIREAIERLEFLGFLDDNRYAENLVREYREFRKYGRQRIIMKLREKKIPDEIIDCQVVNLTRDTEGEAATELVKKYLKKVRNLPKEKIYNRALGFLMRRGYNYDIAKSALQKELKSLD